MLRKILATVFIFLLVLNFSWCAQPIRNTAPEKAKNFTLADLKNKQVSFLDFQGKPVIIFFWTTWCPFCRQELTELGRMYETISKDGVQLLAIDVQESKYKVENFVKSRNIPFTMLLDSDASVADDYGILGVPTYFLIDKTGYIRSETNRFPKEKYKELISQ